jgi:hypothetical protein
MLKLLAEGFSITVAHLQAVEGIVQVGIASWVARCVEEVVLLTLYKCHWALQLVQEKP